MNRIKIEVRGIVQGVGFRPFIHKLVVKYNLKGYVMNTQSGVEIEAEGENNNLQAFVRAIEQESPELAIIESLHTEYRNSLKNFTDFQIVKSKAAETADYTLVSPDVGICEQCREELFTPGDRRYRYPFINCTNCGPRYTIIQDVPYDRKSTVMSSFPLCSACETEYGDIENRRYHAQPDCCSDCGPSVFFMDSDGRKVEGEAITLAKAALKRGDILAIKGIGGFHLTTIPQAAQLLRQRKTREHKPFAVMARDMTVIRKYCLVSEEEEKLLCSAKKPIVLLKKKNDSDFLESAIAPGIRELGVMLPYSPLHELLLQDEDGRDPELLIMTSANRSEAPIIYKNEEALQGLAKIADGFLLHNRDIHTRCDDSVVRVFEENEYLIRRSRGYAPYPIRLKQKLMPMLACGAEMKASFCISKDHYAFLSPHIGDLKNVETMLSYEEQLQHYHKLFHQTPEAIVCDLHPDYLSTEYAVKRARELQVRCYFVQHHHAHMASCMADNELIGSVIGIIWDGTGLGLQNQIWGGEFLVGDYSHFERAGTIRELKLPGGDNAVSQISRIGYGLLFDTFGELEMHKIAGQDPEPLLRRMLESGGCTLTSSIGRLFDGVAAIIGILSRVQYEGQAAILLENRASLSNSELHYQFKIDYSDDMEQIDWAPMIAEIWKDREMDIDQEEIAAKFINTLCIMAEETVKRIRKKYDVDRVVLSGGVFQNMILLKKLKARLEAAGFLVYCHKRVATSDEGLALGQLMAVHEGGYIKCV